MGSPNAVLATLWERTCGTSSNALGKQIRGIKRWSDWKDVAANAEQWMIEVDEFVRFFSK